MTRARSFDAWAPEYDRYRPSYPQALFDLVAERLGLPERAAVVDLGAGTGKASLALAARGWRVTAVEPGEPMLEVLRQRAAEASVAVETRAARAEDTGLPEAAFDLATAAQAFHWFDAPRALAEIGRIVRPGGGLALFWNVRDADVSPLVAEYNALVSTLGGESPGALRQGPREETRTAILAAGVFEEPAFVQVRHDLAMTVDDLMGLAFTSSAVRTLPHAGQVEYRRALEGLLARHGIGPATTVELPYVVDCWIAARSATPN